MIRHPTFRITPDLPRDPRFPRPLTHLAHRHGKTIAVAALGQAFENQPKGRLPVTLEIDRVHLQHQSPEELKFLVTEIIAGQTPAGITCFGYLFGDGSILVAQGIPGRPEAVQVVPLILRLDMAVSYQSSRQTKTFRIDRQNAHLTTEREILPSGFMVQLQAELQAWALLLDTLPHAVPTQIGQKISGILGRDIPAPSPDLDGQPYDWPAALHIRRADAAQMRLFEDFAHAAWIRTCVEFPELLKTKQVFVEITSVLPSQKKHRSGVDAIVVRKDQASDEDRGRTAAFLKALLKHPSAPAGLDELVATVWEFSLGTATDNLAGLPIYFCTDHTKLSGHEILSACERFADLPVRSAKPATDLN